MNIDPNVLRDCTQRLLESCTADFIGSEGENSTVATTDTNVTASAALMSQPNNAPTKEVVVMTQMETSTESSSEPGYRTSRWWLPIPCPVLSCQYLRDLFYFLQEPMRFLLTF